MASHQHFQADLFSKNHSVEMRSVGSNETVVPEVGSGRWEKMGDFDTFDLLGDGSLYVVDAPGHLPGHVSLLCRLGVGKWMFLAGDTAHDTRLLTGEKEVGTWEGEGGRMLCIHLDKAAAEGSIARLRRLKEVEGDGVEIVIAHDPEWATRNRACFFPNWLEG